MKNTHRCECAFCRGTARNPCGNPCKDSELLLTQTVKSVIIVHLINRLREEDGDMVSILCDNPEGPPYNAIICNGQWTGYEDCRFDGDSLIECLQKAVDFLEKYNVS